LLTSLDADAELRPPELTAASQTGRPFGKDDYLAIRRALPRRSSILASLAIVAVMSATMALAIWLSRHSLLGLVSAQFLMAIVMFQGFGLLHECGHGNASDRNWVNVYLGHLASVFCFLPFYPWRYIHQAHHNLTGDLERDPTLDAVRRWRKRGSVPLIVRLAWRSWIPLGAVVQHLVFWSYPITLLRGPSATRRQAVRCLTSIGFLVAAYATAVAFVGFDALVRFLPAVAIYLVMVEMVNLPHHLGTETFTEKLPVWEQWRATRSCSYPPGLSDFLVLNFNLHTEHHLFPHLPWYQLRAANRLLAPALGRRYQEEVGIGWNLEYRRRDIQHLILSEPAEARTPADGPSLS
jgi:fatty acid desaturase